MVIRKNLTKFISSKLGGILLPLLLFSACATVQNEQSIKLQAMLSAKDYQKALVFVRSPEFFPEKNSLLVKKMEEGGVLHRLEKYEESAKVLSDAKDLSEELFTQSISKKIAASTLGSESSDNYYGDIYERSMLRFIAALDHLLIWQEQKTTDPQIARQNLFSARANILDWDTLLEKSQDELYGTKGHYKDDLLAKVFGGLVHEFSGSSGDRQTARTLYQNAEKLLQGPYSEYPLFKDSGLKDETLAFLKAQVKRMKSGRRYQAPSLVVVEQKSLIAPKEAEKIEIPIPLGRIAFHARLSQGAMSPQEFVAFLTTGSQNAQPKISFELPKIREQASEKEKQNLFLVNMETSEVLGELPLIHINPLSEIARQALINKRSAIEGRLTTRLITKYLSAIAGIFISYNAALKTGVPEFIALPGAVSAFKVTFAQIARSERADLRQWRSLPHEVLIGFWEKAIQPGAYGLYDQKPQKDSKQNLIKEFVIKKGDSSALVNFWN